MRVSPGSGSVHLLYGQVNRMEGQRRPSHSTRGGSGACTKLRPSSKTTPPGSQRQGRTPADNAWLLFKMTLTLRLTLGLGKGVQKLPTLP